jgi:hypothetical protein
MLRILSLTLSGNSTVACRLFCRALAAQKAPVRWVALLSLPPNEQLLSTLIMIGACEERPDNGHV